MQSVDYEASRVSQADEERIGCKESFKAAQMVIFVGRVRRALHSVWAEERDETSRSIMSGARCTACGRRSAARRHAAS